MECLKPLRGTYPVLPNLAVLLLFLAVTNSWAATYDPATSFEAGFTSHSNPNGVWSYGYSSGFTAPVTLYTQTSQPGVHGPNAQYWSSSPAITATSSVQFNDGPLYSDGNVDIPAQGLTLVWFGAQYSDVVFTAPATGDYSLTGVFLGSQHNIGSVVGVVVNGRLVFNSTVTGEGQTVPFTATVTLTAGSTVVFSAGPGGGNQNTGLSAAVTGPLPSTAVTYDPTASFEAGFLSRSNPNGPWSYGYSSGFTTPVTLFTQAVQGGIPSPNEQLWLSPSINNKNSPAVALNNGPAFNSDTVVAAANQLLLVSGIGGQYADVVFTAPSAGMYSVAGSFLGDQSGIGVAAGVVANGAVIFNAKVTSLGQTMPFNQTVTLAAGSTVVFSVGPAGGLQNTGLSAAITGPIGSAESPTIAGVFPVGSTVPTIQSGEWVSIYGTNLASSTVTWNGDFPTLLGDTSVTIDGKSAYLWFVSPDQINLQVPDDIATGPVPVVVTTASGTATSTVTLAPFAPAFLLLDSKHVAGIILRSNGSGAYGGGTYDILGPTGNSLGYATVAAAAGDYIELFAGGFGPTNPAALAGQAFSGPAPATGPVTILINNVGVTPAFAGLVGAGLYQVNLTVPAGLGAGDVPLVATVGGAQSPSGVVISLQ